MSYKKNISLKRIRYSKDLARSFREESIHYQKPDIIYCSWPLIDFAYEAVRYGQEHNVPVVIDIRDLWPDIFTQPFPKLLQPLVKMGVNLMFKRRVSYVMQNATAVVAVIPKFLKLAERYGRILQPQDHVVHLSYDGTPVSKEERQQADSFWIDQGLNENQCIVSFVGTIGNRIGDFDALVEAAKKSDDPSIKFVFCGTGEYFGILQEKTKFLSNVLLPGYRNRAEIQSLLKLSTFGLLAYRNTEDFIDHLPSKVSEYFSQGVIMLTSLRGESKNLLEREHCGSFYSDADMLLATIKKLKGDKRMLGAMSKNALSLFYREFDASKVYNDFYKFLESLTKDTMEEQGKMIDRA